MRKSLVAAIGIALVAAASAASAQVSVDWTWKASHRCNNVSPALTVTGIPEGTKSLSFEMNDLDFRNKDHGGGSVPHESGDTANVAEGALKSNYLGPCPNNFASFGHTYQITVRALDASGNELSRGAKGKDFNSKTAQ